MVPPTFGWKPKHHIHIRWHDHNFTIQSPCRLGVLLSTALTTILVGLGLALAEATPIKCVLTAPYAHIFLV
jgi:hypothetical protein